MRDVLGAGRTAQVLADNDDAVVKLFFDWVPIHLIDAEEHATAAAAEAGAPAPRLLGRVERACLLTVPCRTVRVARTSSVNMTARRA